MAISGLAQPSTCAGAWLKSELEQCVARLRTQKREGAKPHGNKSACTDKQGRKARHIEESGEAPGVPHEEAERGAWAIVDKDSSGNKNGSGRSIQITTVSPTPVGRILGPGQEDARDPQEDGVLNTWPVIAKNPVIQHRGGAGSP
ncbi:hypothetical protein [Bosea sp. 2KB_26]|uniref:hypothetical protein n=1 Tax=Bosea sp. 2KB_26 TaxID=3237475 RepID=UPI003F8E62AE